MYAGVCVCVRLCYDPPGEMKLVHGRQLTGIEGRLRECSVECVLVPLHLGAKRVTNKFPDILIFWLTFWLTHIMYIIRNPPIKIYLIKYLVSQVIKIIQKPRLPRNRKPSCDLIL
jgi:hypothetical protein